MSKKLNVSDSDYLSIENVEKVDSTWTDAADKAQDSLNDNEAVSKKDSDDMSEHAAA